MSKIIRLTKGQAAIVDDEDYESLSKWNWYAQWSAFTKSFYAARGSRKAGRRTILMHRELLGLTSGSKLCADHINRDTLDNRRSNLRVATRSQNRVNSRLRCDSLTGFKGVSNSKSGRYRAQIRNKGKNTYLGTFDTPEEAFGVYSLAAKRLHGEFA